MRLNPDCIRDILLEIERYASFEETYTYDPDDLPDESYLSKYDSDTVLYHIRQADQSGLLMDTNWRLFEYVNIQDLSPSGHEFLSNIRSAALWKKVLQKCANASLPIIIKFAEIVASEAFLP